MREEGGKTGKEHQAPILAAFEFKVRRGTPIRAQVWRLCLATEGPKAPSSWVVPPLRTIVEVAFSVNGDLAAETGEFRPLSLRFEGLLPRLLNNVPIQVAGGQDAQKIPADSPGLTLAFRGRGARTNEPSGRRDAALPLYCTGSLIIPPLIPPPMPPIPPPIPPMPACGFSMRARNPAI